MKRILRFILQIPAPAAILLVLFYQRCLSPLKGTKCCRFVPTCSEYAKEALKVHGFLKGTALTIWRLCRCHPFYHGNLYDPIPPKKNSQ